MHTCIHTYVYIHRYIHIHVQGSRRPYPRTRKKEGKNKKKPSWHRVAREPEAMSAAINCKAVASLPPAVWEPPSFVLEAS